LRLSHGSTKIKEASAAVGGLPRCTRLMVRTSSNKDWYYEGPRGDGPIHSHPYYTIGRAKLSRTILYCLPNAASLK